MGAISEAVRRHPGAFRSSAFRHSFAAVGRRSRVITEVDPRVSSFDLRSSFGVMLALNTQVLLLGVPYSNATSFHFSEWLCDVPYRHAVERSAKLRLPNRPVEEVAFVDYQPKPSGGGGYYGKRTMDFNRVGSILEESRKVSVATIGNAVARRFSMRDLCDYAQSKMETDSDLFRTREDETGKITNLKDGKIVLVDLTDGAGRTSQQQWSVVDPYRLIIPRDVSWSILGEAKLAQDP
jgi:aminoglycoside N3'-acetyltransferase